MRAQNYRYWVLWRCPAVRFLDYQKVKQAEREKAAELFGTAEEPTELASKVCQPTGMQAEFSSLYGTNRVQIMGTKSNTFDASAANGPSGATKSKIARLKLTDKERKKLQDMIKKASSLEEIIRLEKALNEGRLPPGVIVDDAMEE